METQVGLEWSIRPCPESVQQEQVQLPIRRHPPSLVPTMSLANVTAKLRLSETICFHLMCTMLVQLFVNKCRVGACFAHASRAIQNPSLFLPFFLF